MNSIAGLISTIINVYSAQDGQYSITAKVTTIVTGACSVITAFCFLLYNNWALSRVRRHHLRETEEGRRDLEADRSDDHAGEGMFEKVKRKVHEPALQPGSVV